MIYRKEIMWDVSKTVEKGEIRKDLKEGNMKYKEERRKLKEEKKRYLK